MEHYRSQLVAKRVIQEYKIDYEETFAIVTCLTSIGSLTAIVAMHGWQLF